MVWELGTHATGANFVVQSPFTRQLIQCNRVLYSAGSIRAILYCICTVIRRTILIEENLNTYTCNLTSFDLVSDIHLHCVTT